MATRRSTLPTARAAARRVAQLTALHFQLRIELKRIQPLIWRRILVPETITLPKLHTVFQAAMGWTDSHLHQFEINGQGYGMLDPDSPDEDFYLDERRVRLKPFVDAGIRRFTYLYDFGDHWDHVVHVEDLVPPPSTQKAICTAGENACPPEDVGSVSGYFEFLAAIKDPTHEEHHSMLNWIGYDFDPGAFDIDHVNAMLAHIKA